MNFGVGEKVHKKGFFIFLIAFEKKFQPFRMKAVGLFLLFSDLTTPDWCTLFCGCALTLTILLQTLLNIALVPVDVGLAWGALPFPLSGGGLWHELNCWQVLHHRTVCTIIQLAYHSRTSTSSAWIWYLQGSLVNWNKSEFCDPVSPCWTDGK